ncbi:hypothetical protein NDU88_005712 [Pleurodeles waltl]|uniref:Uncharacterized protein n=1 Tax=Pleurodeles waltl TaxID=8319 RepID=A0AAV7TWB0_PLEWA|nr:hypothetical protein NDU88_005712 [Pleurodeles waltl]
MAIRCPTQVRPPLLSTRFSHYPIQLRPRPPPCSSRSTLLERQAGPSSGPLHSRGHPLIPQGVPTVPTALSKVPGNLSARPRGLHSPTSRIPLSGCAHLLGAPGVRSSSCHLRGLKNQQDSSIDIGARGGPRCLSNAVQFPVTTARGPSRAAAPPHLPRRQHRLTQARGSEVELRQAPGHSNSAAPRRVRLSRSERIIPLGPWEGRSSGSIGRPCRSHATTRLTSWLVQPRPPTI